MDTGEYETNAFVIVSFERKAALCRLWLTSLRNNISSIPYQFYEASPESSHTFPSAALDIESALRSEGHVVFYDAPRQGIWYFQLPSNGGQPKTPPDATRFSLVVGEQGTLDASALQKVRAQAQVTNNTATCSSAVPALELIHRQTLSSPLQNTTSSLRDHEFKEAQCGLDTKAGGTTQHALYESFVASLLLTLSTAFCSRTGAIPLNYRTVLLPPDTARAFESREAALDKYPAIGTFKTFLTTAGSLVLSLAVTRCRGLLSLDGSSASGPTPQGQRILAAPFGVMARNQFGVSGDGVMSMAQTPNTQMISLRCGLESHDSSWKQACSRYLQYRGVSVSRLQGSHWVNLLMPRPRLSTMKNDQWVPTPSSAVTLPWPGSLCFRKRAVDIPSTSRVVDTVLSGHEETHDPLGSAKTWFNSAPEREERVSKRNAERAAPAPKHVVVTESKSEKPNDSLLTSLRRTSATAAAAVLYPTPPSGMQPTSALTPLVDGTLSSPSNPLSAPTTTDSETTVSISASTAVTLDDNLDFVEPKRQPNDSNLLQDADNVFGDMGGDMFDENDITEADFNFFDQQPGEIDLDVSMTDLAPADNGALPISKNGEDIQVPIEEIPPTTQPDLEPIIFAKPELKHARSCRIEESVQRGRDSRPTSAKRESSPFDPFTVFKRVKASLRMATDDMDHVSPASDRKTKVFEKVDFDPRLPMINKKYEQGGLFDWGDSLKSGKPKPDSWMLPETDYLKRHGKPGRRIKDKPTPFNSMMKTLTRLEPPNSSPSKLDGSISDRDDSSIESDQDDSSYTTDEPFSPQKPTARHANVEEDALSGVTSLRELEFAEEPDHQLAVELPRFSKPDMSEMPLSAFFSDPEPLALDMSLADEDIIQIAQILTEQAATGSLDICNSPNEETMAGMAKQSQLTNFRCGLRMLEDVALQYLGRVVPLRLKGLLDVQDIHLLPQPTRLPLRPVPGRESASEPARASNLYQMPSPHLEVRRADVKLSVLPSAVSFWDSLGLGPSSGSKNVNAVCVFPGWNGMGDSVKTFLDRSKSVYEFLKLGNFDNMALGPDLEDGLLPYEVDRISTSPDATVTGHGSALIQSMEALHGPYSSLTATETNFVVYVVYSPSNPATILEACAAFQRFGEANQKMSALKKNPAQNELILQLVSVDLISSSTFHVVTPAPELIKLCMETYDRCTLFGGPMPAPAIMIEQLMPRIIDFKLVNIPSASLIRENSCIHISYAQSIDDRWVTAAWTDDWGNQQTTASYCLGRKGKPQSRSMNEVAHEIWETTLDLISTWRVQWRIIITKCGPMNQQEIDFWVDLARTEINATVTMILMTVDTNPSLQLLPPIMKLPQSVTSLATTPVSTPQASAVSPEQTTTSARESNATATTPGDNTAVDADADATLADVSDQIWGAIPNHRLSNSISLLEIRPALVSGYLIKRTGMRLEDAPVVMEVNLVHTDAGPRAHEALLRELMSNFRVLGTLARARGVVDRETDIRPWHVAAAEKAVRALYLLM